MISSLEIDAEAEPETLRKIFRKKAMTGGGFITLKPGLSGDELERIFENFIPELAPGNLAERVIVALAASPALPQSLAQRLAQIDNREICRMLKRTEMPQVDPAALPEEISGIYEKALASGDVRTRMNLALSDTTPAEIRSRLALDPVPEIRFHARSRQ